MKKYNLIFFGLLFFACLKAQTQTITTYQYWIDNDFANRATVTLPAAQSILNHTLNMTTVGVHTIHYRAKQQNGWSSVISDNFFIPTNDNLTAYEYWYDMDYANRTVVNIPTPSANNQYSLPSGVLYNPDCRKNSKFHIRFKQTTRGWSSVLTKPCVPCDHNNITAYRYWFDNNFGNAQTVVLTTPISNLQGNLTLNTTGLVVWQTYQLHAQFLDERGVWSSVLTKPYTVCGIVTANITGATEFCTGSNTVLTASGSTNNYIWSTGATTSSVTVNTADTYTVTVTAAAGCYATASIGVSSIPSPMVTLTGSNTFCHGDSTTITATGGGDYVWSSGETTADIHVQTAGVYRVTVTNTGGCSTTASMNINELPTPTATVSGDKFICAGETTTLTAAGGNVYAWANGSTTAAVSVAPNASATYTVTVTNVQGCAAIVNTLVTVTPIPTPTIGATGNTLTTGTADTYQWYLNGTPIVGATNQSYNALQTGNYSVEMSINGCVGTSPDFPHTYIGVEPSALQNIRLYPNPTESTAFLDFGESFSMIYEVQICDLSGHIISTLGKPEEPTLSLDLTNLPAGVYIVRINRLENIKLIKI